MSVKDRLSKLEKEQLKQWYIDGMPVSDICTALGISRDAFYYHKNKFAKQGIDLEELRLANLRSKKNLEQKETEFLNTLIIAFESGIKEIEKI
jgi:transposase